MAFSIALQVIASGFLLKTAFRDPGTIPSRVMNNLSYVILCRTIWGLRKTDPLTWMSAIWYIIF